MTEIKNNRGFSSLETMGNIWGAHILLAALLYPRIFLPDTDDEAKKTLYEIICLVGGTVLLLLNLIALVLLFTRTSWVAAAKIFFVLLIWYAITCICILFNNLRDIQSLLMLVGDAAEQMRDESVFAINAANAKIEAWQSKLTVSQEIEMSMASILKKCAPLVLLIMRKEKNVVHICLEAFKLAMASSPLLKKLF